MTTRSDFEPTNALGRFFGVVAQGRSYLNVLYLFFAFPLGVLYFCFLAVGLSLGLGLLIIWIGLFVLAMVLLLSWLLSAFERLQAIWLLGARMEPLDAFQPLDEVAEGTPFLERAKRLLSDRFTWTGPVFLLLKFPLGVISFVAVVTLVATSGALLSAPFIYHWENVQFHFGWGIWYVDTLPEALVCSVVGFFLAVVSLHAFNGLAWVWRRLAEALLGRRTVEPMAPEAPSAASPPPEAAAEPA